VASPPRCAEEEQVEGRAAACAQLLGIAVDVRGRTSRRKEGRSRSRQGRSRTGAGTKTPS
jgi:ribosomal protein L13E